MSYIQGAVASVANANRERYRASCAEIAAIFREYGATRVVDCWGVDVPDGTTTDFKRAVKAGEDETVVFSWIVWPDRATCDAAGLKMRSDERMHAIEMPFDTQRMIYGGFEPLFDTEAG